MSHADLSRFEWRRAASLDELCALLAERGPAQPRPVLLGGGTDFMVESVLAPPRPLRSPLPLVIDVSRLAELRAIAWDGSLLRIGAAATYLEIRRHPAVRERAPLLERVTHEVGGPGIQARGTLGGNLGTASPAADGVAALAAFDPVVVVQSVRGARRIPMAELQTGYKQSTRAPDEVIVAIELRPPAAGSPWMWRKVAARRAQAIAKVSVAALAELGGGRARRFGLALGAVAPVTALMPRTRALVMGSALAELTREALERAVDADTSPIDDIRSTAAYRAHCARALVCAFLREIGAGV